MELNFKSLEEYLQGYIDDQIEQDLAEVTSAQRLAFIEKYMEFVSPKQLRRGTSTASEDKDFNLVEVE